MPSDPIEYRSPTTQAPRNNRPLSKWLMLLVIWLVGVIVWVLYLGLAAVVILRVLLRVV